MTPDRPPELSDRQARAVILAAESLGFEREPDLAAAWYDHDLHDDARYALAHLRDRDPARLAAALAAAEPIAASCAAWRITETKGFSLADTDPVIQAAIEYGFRPPQSDLPLERSMLRFEQARAAVAFLWEREPDRLGALLGETARLAPLPDTALRWDGCRGRPDACRCSRSY